MSSVEPTEDRPAAPEPRDPALGASVRAAGVATLVLTVFAGLAMSPLWAVGTLVGGALATVNLILFIRLGEAFLSQHKKAAPWIVLGSIKLLGLFACVFIIMRNESVSAMAFVIGYGALPIGIAVSTLARAKAPRPLDN